jgi:hypothetical protein
MFPNPIMFPNLIQHLPSAAPVPMAAVPFDLPIHPTVVAALMVGAVAVLCSVIRLFEPSRHTAQPLAPPPPGPLGGQRSRVAAHA